MKQVVAVRSIVVMPTVAKILLDKSDLILLSLIYVFNLLQRK